MQAFFDKNNKFNCLKICKKFLTATFFIGTFNKFGLNNMFSTKNKKSLSTKIGKQRKLY